MADDVLELTRKCAKVIGVRPYVEFAENDAEAFRLLCWLTNKGTVEFNLRSGDFDYWTENTIIQDSCSTPAELRLALMRAVVKVSQDGR